MKIWKVCPSCNYERNITDEGPLGRCPSCEIFYQKYHDRKFGVTQKTQEQYLEEHMEKTEREDRKKALIITFIIFMVILFAPIFEFNLIASTHDTGESWSDFFTIDVICILLIGFVITYKSIYKKRRRSREMQYTIESYSVQKGVRTH